MKQGSIMNFMKKKGADESTEQTASKAKNLKQASQTTPKKKSRSPSAEKKHIEKDEKVPSRESSKKKSSAVKDKVAAKEIKPSSKKRRHIIDDEDEEYEPQSDEELVSDIMIPPKESKLENQVSNNISNFAPALSLSAEGTSFYSLVQALTKIENTKGEGSKDLMKEVLSELFKNIILKTPDDLPRAYYFLLSKVGPEYRSPEFGIGTGILEKVVGKAIGISDKQIKQKMVELGDLALVAMEGKKTLGTMDKFSGFGSSNNTKKDLSLKQVMDIFTELANIKGKSSMAEKEKLLVRLIFGSNKEEIKYIIRSLQKGLKIGASFKTIVSALARAVCKIYNEEPTSSKTKSSPKKSKVSNILEEKEAERIILISIFNLSDEDIVFHHLIEVVNERRNFNELISACDITPGIPVKPQLAKPTTGIKIILERFEGVPFTCEYKYDGFRGQVHHYPAKDGTFKTEIFSRNLENMSESYPDIIQYVDSIHSDKVKSFILDCEIVAFDQKTGKILPFHNLTTRARKNVSVKDISTHVCMFLFDILYFNGKNECGKTLEERRKLLTSNFEESHNIQFAKYASSEKIEEMEGFMNEAIAAGTEGLIVKALYKNSEYQPGQRNFNWLKLKKDYLETSIGDSLDLVPIGADYGKGKRKGFFGSFLLACWDEDNEKFQTVTMTATGLKDEDLENFYNYFTPLIIKEPRQDYDVGNLNVDVWFDANTVWEIKTADLSQSPIYSAAKNLSPENRGISLRFPRFIRVRPDKKPEESTTSEEILQMYKNQEKSTKKINFNEEEFYD